MQDTILLVEEYVKRGTLLPANLLFHKDTEKIIRDSKRYSPISLEELKEAIKILDIDDDNLFLSSNPFSPFVYINDLAYVDISSLDKNYLETFQMKLTIEHHTERIETLKEEGNYEDIILLTGNKYILNVFHDAYEYIPDNQKYKVFRATYTQMEYGFSAFRSEILEEVLTLNQDASFKEQLEVDKEGYLTIYRGEGKLSRSVVEAHSWTTNQGVAKFFANRFDKEGNLYQAKVHIDNVIDFIDERNEDEILVLPEHVLDIVKI